MTSFLLIFFLPQLIAGPGAAVCLIWLLRRPAITAIRYFWGALALWDLSAIIFMLPSANQLHTMGGGYLITGFVFCLAASTFVVMRFFTHHVYLLLGQNAERHRWYLIGTVVIPGMQVAMVALLNLLATG